ncbi:hypothetical protein QIS99_04385 [Streptomyces sp. B-S-A8]|uniref:Albusnodin family lasso peptide n=1 Tax=Streptomyces solicavernae TaxID=3043614 RepID=A0ABT6RMC6_9ACTN|nr:hypothetical protein [Streptomyces sp. B-S-A8]MDI3385455.1 hypothetical protein [Streptomyces sp. B-S-A8]
MTAVAVEITPRSVAPVEPKEITAPVLVEDLEALTDGAVPGCGDDNPYR